MGIKDLYTNSRYQYLYPEAAYEGGISSHHITNW